MRPVLRAIVVSLVFICPAVGVPAARGDSITTRHPYLMDVERAQAYARALRERLPFVPGEVLVKFRDVSTEAGRMRALATLKHAPDRPVRVEWIGEVALVRNAEEPDAEQAARVLNLQREVEYAQPNYFSRIASEPNDAGYRRQWNMQALDMPRAWDINAGAASSVTVAVIDSGVTTTGDTYEFPLWTGSTFETVPIAFGRNPDLAASFDTPHDFVFWTGPVVDMVGHGTHVAGTIAQLTNNNIGFAGMAYNARIMPLKACFGYWELQLFFSSNGTPGFLDPEEGGGCPTSAVIEAIRFAADHGAKVINLSLGGPGASPAYRDAIRYAVDHGVFVAMAMGNEYEQGNPVGYPAAYASEIDGAVSVAAVGRSLKRAYYSNTGPHAEIAAPGGDDRDGGLAGLIFQTGVFDADFDPWSVVVPRFDRFYEQPNEGTSMATPHVAGFAALLVSQGIASPRAIEAAMKRFARDLGPAGRDDEYGAGLIDPRMTLRGLGVAK